MCKTERIVKYHRLLCDVCKNSDTKKRRIATFKRIAYNDADVVRAITDVVHNVLQGKVHLTRQRVNKLKKHKQHLRKLVKPRGMSLQQRKDLIIQKGGFLPFLAPLIPLIIKAATIAGPLIAKGAALGAAGTAAGHVTGKIIEKIKSG